MMEMSFLFDFLFIWETLDASSIPMELNRSMNVLSRNFYLVIFVFLWISIKMLKKINN